VTRLTSRLAIAAAAVVLLPGITFAAQNIAVRFDPTKPNQKLATIWLGYLLARVAYHEKHNLPVPLSGEIVPSFSEELDARSSATHIYRELQEKDATLKDPYWESLSAVDHRGFMGAYVWTFLRRPQWPSTERPSNLSAFDAWKKQALPKHKAQTYGWLEAGKP